MTEATEKAEADALSNAPLYSVTPGKQGEPDKIEVLPRPPSEVAGPVDGDRVRKPPHYTRFKIEPVTFIMENRLDFATGNCIKYLCRAGYKLYEGMDAAQSEITDLEKVRRYCEMRINQLKGKEVL